MHIEVIKRLTKGKNSIDKKAMLAVLLALTTVCAAVCSLLLAGSVSARAAEDRQPTRIELNELSGTYGSMSGTTLIGNALSGTIYFNDNTSGPLSDYKDDSGYTLNLPDLRPTDEEAQQESYTRQVSVSYEEGGRKETSKEITVTITWDEPTENSLSAIPQTSSFTAGVPIPDDAFNVQISYSTILGLQTRTLTAGDYHFVYQGGGDTLEFGDESVTIVYTEGGKEFSRPINFSLFGIQVTEEPVNAPLPTIQESLTEDYTAAFQDFVFNNFNGSESIIDDGVLSSTPGSNSTITVKAKDAGDYIITFTAQEGYKYRSIPSYAVSIPKKGDPETIIGVQYTIHINKVNLTSVTFTLPATSWDYDGTTAGHEPTGLVAVGVGSESINFGTAGEDGAVTVTWEYRVKDGKDLPDNEMPTDAGKYQVRAVLSGLKNYNDSNDLCAWQDFEILSKKVALPTLAQDSFPYANERIEPSINHGIDPWDGIYSVTNAGGLNKGNYTVVFTLEHPNNYHWATTGDGEISGDNNEKYTLTWEITQAQNRVEGEPSVPSWIYNEDGIQR